MYFNISIDVDTYATDYLSPNCDIEKMVISSYQTEMSKLITYFEQKNIRATLFVVANHAKIPFVRDYLKEIVTHGHEIASHSFSHCRNFVQLDPIKMEDEIRRSKETLEDMLGIEIKGFRAPGYTITHQVWELLIKNGFTYDASLNNSFFYCAFKTLYKFFSAKGHFFVVQKRDGFPVGSSPFEVNRLYFKRIQSRDFWEIPFDYSKVISFPFLIFMLNQLPDWIVRKMVRAIAESPKEIVQIQFHDYDLMRREEVGPFLSDIYFIKKYNKKPVEKRKILYDSITSDLLSNRTPILLKDYVQVKSKTLSERSNN